MTDDALSEEIAAKAQIGKDVLGAKLPAVEVKAKTTVQGGDVRYMQGWRFRVVGVDGLRFMEVADTDGSLRLVAGLRREGATLADWWARKPTSLTVELCGPHGATLRRYEIAWPVGDNGLTAQRRETARYFLSPLKADVEEIAREILFIPGPISWVEQKRSATDPAVIGDLREAARALDELAKRPVEVMVDGTNLVSRADPPTS